MTSHEAFDALCYWVTVVTAGDSAKNKTKNNKTNPDLSHLSITSNGLSTEEKTIENPLGVLPYQFEPEFDSECPEKHIGWGRG